MRTDFPLRTACLRRLANICGVYPPAIRPAIRYYYYLSFCLPHSPLAPGDIELLNVFAVPVGAPEEEL